MSDTFHIGDRAVIIDMHHTWQTLYPWMIGSEVIITSELVRRSQLFAHKCDGDALARATALESGITGWYFLPGQLRKIYPRQDWTTLCRLTDLPHEVSA